jgi:hypothetical protein
LKSIIEVQEDKTAKGGIEFLGIHPFETCFQPTSSAESPLSPQIISEITSNSEMKCIIVSSKPNHQVNYLGDLTGDITRPIIIPVTLNVQPVST